MSYRKLILFLLFFLLSAANSWSYKAAKSVDEVRQIDGKRKYNYYLNDSLVGYFQSIFKADVEFNNIPCYITHERIVLDFAPVGQDYKIQIRNRHYFNEAGYYIGDDMLISSGGKAHRLYLLNKKEVLSGYYTDGEQKENIEQFLSPTIFTLDNNMIDQVEFLLAFKDIKVGDTIIDSIFAPQTMIQSQVKIVVEDYVGKRYGNIYDSAYACHFIEPIEQYAFMTKDRKLIKLTQESQGISVVLVESPLDKMAPKEKALTFIGFVKRIPIYIVYLIFGIIFASPFLLKNYKRPEIYIALVLGGAVYLINNYVTFPLQKWYGAEILIPAMEKGSSLYLYGALTTLISGFFQETIKLIPIILIFLWKRPTQKLSIAIGVLAGIGYAIYAASSITGNPYQIGAMPILSVAVFGQIVMILFHTAAGAGYGYGINRGWKQLFMIWLPLVLIHTLYDYLLVFQQKGGIDAALVEMSRVIICCITILIIYIIAKRRK